MTARPARGPVTFIAAAAIAAILAAAGPAPARGAPIRTLDADLEDEVASMDGEGEQAVLRTSSGRTVPVADVKEVRFASADREPRPGAIRVFLTTGDELTGEIARGDDEKLVVRTASLGEVDVALDLLRAVAYTADEAEIRRFRKEVLPLDAKQDVAVTRSWARQEGILERIDEKGLGFSTGALGKVTLGPDKIIGARVRQFGKGPAAPAGLRARVDLADGCVVFGKLRVLRGGNLTIDSAAKPGLEVKTTDVRTLSFLGGKIVYVSDLDPAEVEERSKLISIVYKHREDANVMGNPLRVDGKLYRKGLGVHAYTRLVYKLDGRYVRLRAIAGLDDDARERRDVVGAVKFQVLVDGKPALGAEGLTLTTRDPAKPLDVDVTGASTIALVADFGESEDTLSRGAFADAFLVRK